MSSSLTVRQSDMPLSAPILYSPYLSSPYFPTDLIFCSWAGCFMLYQCRSSVLVKLHRSAAEGATWCKQHKITAKKRFDGTLNHELHPMARCEIDKSAAGCKASKNAAASLMPVCSRQPCNYSIDSAPRNPTHTS